MLNSIMSLPAAGVGESHVVDIDADRTEPLAQHATVAENHPHDAIAIAVDVVGRPEPPADCAVCMERIEWAAVGPCGHREVCATCAVRIRLVEANRNCCICRAPCPTVVVTGEGGGEWRGCEELAAASRKYWYHEASAAYFDDERQYRAMRRASEPDDDEDGNQGSNTMFFLFYVALYFVAGVWAGLAMGGGIGNWRRALALSSGTGFGMAAIGIMLWFLQTSDGGI